MAKTDVELQERLKTVLMDTAKELGMRVEGDTALFKILEKLPRTVKKMIQRADASELLENNPLADCSIRVCISAAAGRKDGSLFHGKQSCGQSAPRRALEDGPVGASGLSDSFAEGEEHRASKRHRTNDGGMATAPQVSATGIVRTIQAHSAILVTHSKYFKASLTGEWRDGSKRVIDVQVSSEQEFEDLELLIKLAYGPSYVMLDSRPLEKDVLLRLLPLADSFEFLGFLDACIDSLCENLTAQEVFECLEAVPQTLWADDRFKRFLEDAADVVADDLGYTDELFQAGSASHSNEPDANLPLKVAAQALPPFFLEYLMASEGLKVRSENDTFALAMACLDHHVQHGTLTETEAQTYCNGILNRLRFHWMSLHFLSRVVALHPRVALSGQLPEIMGSSLAHRVNPTYLRHPAFENLSFGPPDRSCTERSKFKLSCVFSLEQECMKLEAGGHVSRWVGLAQGYPVSIDVGRHKGKDGAADMVSVGLMVHFPQAFDRLGKLRIHASMHHTGMNTNPIAWGGLVGGRGRLTFDGVFAKKPWVEAIRDGSPFFEDGNVTFDVELDFVRELEA